MRTSRRSFVMGAVMILVGSLAVASGSASARTSSPRPSSVAGSTAITPTSNALDIANAIAVDPAIVTGASFVTVPPSPPLGLPNAVSNTNLTFFPRDGETYGILTTGDATLANKRNDFPNSGTDDGGLPIRGDTDRDVTILKVDLTVPDTMNCLSVRFRFLSEEYPEFVGSSFNDAFIAEMDNSTWTTQGSVITAPDNFAFDPAGNVVSINGTGNATVAPGNAKGTTYDAGTQLLRASTVVTPGAHSLYLSIFDQSDGIYDSAVFLDKLDLIFADSPEACAKGTEADQINGTEGDDQIQGTDEDDLIFAGAGDDIINAGAGDDIIIAEDGNDTVIGGGGNDEIISGKGNDILIGDSQTVTAAVAKKAIARGMPRSWLKAAQEEVPGDDLLNAGGGNDEAVGGDGNDEVIGGGGSDELGAANENGNDEMAGGKGGDTLKGGLGSDKMNGGPGVDECFKGKGDTVKSCEEIFKRHRFYNWQEV